MYENEIKLTTDYVDKQTNKDIECTKSNENKREYDRQNARKTFCFMSD